MCAHTHQHVHVYARTHTQAHQASMHARAPTAKHTQPHTRTHSHYKVQYVDGLRGAFVVHSDTRLDFFADNAILVCVCFSQNSVCVRCSVCPCVCVLWSPPPPSPRTTPPLRARTLVCHHFLIHYPFLRFHRLNQHILHTITLPHTSWPTGTTCPPRTSLGSTSRPRAVANIPHLRTHTHPFIYVAKSA